MMKLTNWIAAGLLAGAIAGCSPESREDYSEAGSAAKDAVSKDASQAAGAISDASAEAKKKADNAMITGKVRSAINTAADVHIDNLDVDTNDGKVTVMGAAKDAKSKSTAIEIAKTQAGKDFDVVDKLTVGG